MGIINHKRSGIHELHVIERRYHNNLLDDYGTDTLKELAILCVPVTSDDEQPTTHFYFINDGQQEDTAIIAGIMLDNISALYNTAKALATGLQLFQKQFEAEKLFRETKESYGDYQKMVAAFFSAASTVSNK